MHSSSISLLYLILMFDTALSHLQDVPSFMTEYRRPVCRPDQTCSYDALGLTFSLCDCPHHDSCLEKHSLKHQNTVYSFCQPYQPPVCWENDVSVVVSGIQTSIRCICPEKFAIKRDKVLENGDVEFRCVSNI